MLLECAQFIRAANRNFDVSKHIFFSENSRFQVCYLIPSKRKLNEYLKTQRIIFTFRECLNLNNFNKSLFSVCTLACQNDWHLWCRQSFHLFNWFRTSLTWNCYAENGEKGYSNPSYSFLQTTKDKKWFFSFNAFEFIRRHENIKQNRNVT